MIRDGKDRRGLHTTTFAETDWPQKHFYYWTTFAMGDGRVPGPKRTKVAHVLVVTAKGFFNHQVESWLTRLIIISTAKSLMVVFLIFKTKTKNKFELYARLQNWRWPLHCKACLLWHNISMSIVIISYTHETYLGTLTTSNLCTIFSATIVRHCIKNKTTVNLRRSNLGIWRLNTCYILIWIYQPYFVSPLLVSSKHYI